MATDNFVCFVCRKAFAQPQIFRETAMEKPPQACPDCGGVLSFTSPKYRPPSRNAIRQWALDQALVEAGQLERSPRYAYGVPASDKVHTLRELRATSSASFGCREHASSTSHAIVAPSCTAMHRVRPRRGPPKT